MQTIGGVHWRFNYLILLIIIKQNREWPSAKRVIPPIRSVRT